MTVATAIVFAVVVVLVAKALWAAREANLADIERLERARDQLLRIQAHEKRPHRPPVMPYEPPGDIAHIEQDVSDEVAMALVEGQDSFWVEPVSDPELGTIVAFGTDEAGMLGTAYWPEEKK